MIDRRRILLGLAGAPAACAPIPSLAAPAAPKAGAGHPDYGMMTICGFAGRVNRRHAELCMQDEDHPEIALLAELETEALEWITTNPAVTTEGIRAKSEALRLMVPASRNGGPSRYATPTDRMAWSLADDIARLLPASSLV